ncbi:NAD-dependent epimerase/dehydratase family protein [Cerasicoccus fimbriatus]|uniref:NAD-dependent epimerase/dehydratase family protein n=1 Tax=Cerasicoccus fimbriatus TaxID=3014554 RepID=UPI0022B3EB81|nr:NAD(P)-dependent oxidoreductase [Cerasicoccus sp. TK19100]
MSFKKIIITGGSGKAGRAVANHLHNGGRAIINVDIKAPEPKLACRFIPVDLTDYGQVVDVLEGADAVVHFAAIPSPSHGPQSEIFRNNTVSTYNVFQAARLHGVKRIVWASSETCFGLPFHQEKPDHAPLSENAPLYPESAYALTKVLGEEMARQFHRWSGITIIGLRLSNVMDPDTDYAKFSKWQDDPKLRAVNMWGYIDSRDVARATECALYCDFNGVDFFTIAAADTVMRMPNDQLMAAAYPDVPYTPTPGPNDALYDISKAREVLGFTPKYSWRDEV